MTNNHNSNSSEGAFVRVFSCLLAGRSNKDFGVISSTGFKPGKRVHKNQDSFVVYSPDHGLFKNNSNGKSTKDVNYNDIMNTRLYAILDGHGNEGEKMSAKARDLLVEYIRSKKPWNCQDALVCYSQIFELIQKELEQENGSDISGTTCTVVSLAGNKLQVANVGDSRAVLARTDSSSGVLTAVPLTMEHSLDKEEELARIKAKGGKVSDCKRDSSSTSRRNSVSQKNPLRIWCSLEPCKQSGPNRRLSLTRRGSVCTSIGLAMTRSLGDKIAHDTSGVICEPSFLGLSLNFESDLFIIAGSDGLWDVITYAEAIDIVNEEAKNNGETWSPQEAAELLVERARLKWENQSRSIDDITCCIIKIHE